MKKLLFIIFVLNFLNNFSQISIKIHPGATIIKDELFNSVFGGSISFQKDNLVYSSSFYRAFDTGIFNRAPGSLIQWGGLVGKKKNRIHYSIGLAGFLVNKVKYYQGQRISERIYGLGIVSKFGFNLINNKHFLMSLDLNTNLNFKYPSIFPVLSFGYGFNKRKNPNENIFSKLSFEIRTGFGFLKNFSSTAIGSVISPTVIGNVSFMKNNLIYTSELISSLNGGSFTSKNGNPFIQFGFFIGKKKNRIQYFLGLGTLFSDESYDLGYYSPVHASTIYNINVSYLGIVSKLKYDLIKKKRFLTRIDLNANLYDRYADRRENGPNFEFIFLPTLSFGYIFNIKTINNTTNPVK